MFDALGLFEGDIAALEADAALTAAARLRATSDRAEAQLLQVAAHFADLHPDPFDDSDTPECLRSQPGEEETKVYGGEGCPAVAEFAPVELGAVLGITSYAAARLIGDALALRHRLPRTWTRVLAGEVQPWRARQIAGACWNLSQVAAALVDAQVADIAQSLTTYRLAKVVRAAVVEADPEAAEEYAKNEAAGRGVWIDPSDIQGNKAVAIKAAAGDVIRFDASIDLIADALVQLGDTDRKDLRRAKAIGWLANPQATLDLWHTFEQANSTTTEPTTTEPTPTEPTPTEPTPTEPTTTEPTTEPTTTEPTPTEPTRTEPIRTPANQDERGGLRGFGGLGRYTLYVHLTDLTLASGSGLVRVADSKVTQRHAGHGGVGPLFAKQLAELIGHPELVDKIVVKPVIDLADKVAVDAYEIPRRIRERVLLRYPRCIFPHCNRPATPGIDLDHIVPYDHSSTGPPGQTSTDNLGPVCRFHHRVKTHGRWKVRRLTDGAFEWTSPHGHVLRVDHTGTHPVTRDHSGSRAIGGKGLSGGGWGGQRGRHGASGSAVSSGRRGTGVGAAAV